MRVVSIRAILAAVLLVVGLAACGGGGPGDLNLTASPPVTLPPTVPSTTGAPSSTPATTLPADSSLVATAHVNRLAVYTTITSPRPASELAGPQVFLAARGPVGWVRVVLPVQPRTLGLVRASDVTVTEVSYRIHIALASGRITVSRHGSPVYQGPIVIRADASSTASGAYYLRKLVTAPESHTTSSPYVYDLTQELTDMVPLGTPIDISR